ncbi:MULTISPECIES: hypothetical protein [Crocosphaera]|uniref:Uncharacterized protein n=5 Tax=Crocosphaera watsonii TaxID=263511 RepID=T2JQA2_CROWT|nr:MULTISPECIES: hypothetical protein [Crocosphaera]EHJ14677.1 hypothetical protein CWATWH0003_0653 [Crocosphaera watsonii WH 0003]MCH2247312.1 hypothetical protein [Crocosphaera sp.]NQZ60573.1 hypothetical protein [Crocosphaera sp.]CCQ49737.1 hypothetical protein CWATWH8502_601 [Crocosphaera watsonii WH 8502]CCQ56879.1 hypothetical protein CWATWH0005_3450 [Crocosphaera watsonii WH 0005]
MTSDTSENPEQQRKTDSKNLESFAEEYDSDKSDNSQAESGKDGDKDFRLRNRNNWIASILALALWATLIFTIVYHLMSTVKFSNYLVDSETPVELEKVQTAVTLVDDTAKTLYSFLGTLVTAVTAYYFKTVADEGNNR